MRVGKTKRKPARTKPVQEVPLYTLWDAARYLHISVAAVARLTGSVLPDAYWINRSWPEDDDDPEISTRLSFRQFAELFLKLSLLGFLARPHLDDRNRRALWTALEQSARGSRTSLPNLATQLLRAMALGSDKQSAKQVRGLLELFLARVERRRGKAIRIFPFTRDPSSDAPRIIVIDPRFRFGQPATIHRFIPTEVIIDRYRGGDSVKFLAEDYDLTTEEIEEAIRYESLPITALLPFGGS
jgi:uncharacterized protein (DUF433 family)